MTKSRSWASRIALICLMDSITRASQRAYNHDDKYAGRFESHLVDCVRACLLGEGTKEVEAPPSDDPSKQRMNREKV